MGVTKLPNPRGFHNPKPVTIDWIFSNCTIDEKGCWIWLGGTGTRGYPTTMVNGKTIRISHLSYETYRNEPFPSGLYALHSCDNPSCCNPEHISAGTQQDNMNHMKIRGRFEGFSQSNRRAKGERHGMAKLSPSQVKTIREQYSFGNTSTYKLAKEYGVHRNTIRLIIKGENWKCV